MGQIQFIVLVGIGVPMTIGIFAILVRLKSMQRQLADRNAEVDERFRTLLEQLSQRYTDIIAEVRSVKERSDDAERTDDDLYEVAREIVLMAGRASTSLLQRTLRIRYQRAAALMDRLEAEEIIGPADGIHPREVLVDDE